MDSDRRPPTPHYFEHERPEVAALVPAAARRVVDVGCGAGALGRALKRARPGVQVRGVELVPAQAERARAALDDVAVGDAGDGLPAGWPRPDCVIFADVLEHLVDPWAALRRWRSDLTAGGAVIVSVPNILHRSILGELRRFRWDYKEEGILDRTHLRFFTRRTAIELLEQAGLRVTRLQRCMDGRPLGPLGHLLLWPRQRLERAGSIRSADLDPLGLLADLYTVQLVLVGQG